MMKGREINFFTHRDIGETYSQALSGFQVHAVN